MRETRYTVVILDDRGRTLRRLGMPRGSLLGGLVLLSVSLLIILTLSVHGLANRDLAAETRAIAQENRELLELERLLSEKLPASRQLATRAELTFAQIWSKSGLGPEPNALGVGPVASPTQADDSRPTLSSKYAPYHRTLELLEAPMELDHLQTEAPKLESLLGQLLEYFHDQERILGNTPSIKPAHTVWETSSFGRRRDPITGQWMLHKGVDLAGRTGDSIYAPADGVVIWTGRRGGYGNTVVIDHGFGIQTHFAHLSAYKVRLGERVARSQLIAEMGNTGKSTGPHLHYEVRRMGQPLNPANFIMD